MKAEEEKRRIELEYIAALKRVEDDLMAFKSEPLHLLKENESILNYYFARDKKNWRRKEGNLTTVLL
jgi:hypothetical protein